MVEREMVRSVPERRAQALGRGAWRVSEIISTQASHLRGEPVGSVEKPIRLALFGVQYQAHASGPTP